LPKDTVAARALRYATDAVRRAPNSSDAWTAMGIANLVNHPRTLEGSREGFERAIALDPGNAEPHHLLGFTAALAGEDSVGLAHDRMALALEPARPVTIMHLAHFALKHRRTAEALRWVDSALVVNPAFVNGHMLRVTLLLVAGDTSEARAEVARWRSLPSPAFYIPLYERALAPRGQDSAQVRAWREQIRAAIPAELPVNLGGYSALMVMVADGDAATVMPLFEASQPRGAYIHYFMSFPVFDPIRGDARFQRLFQETTP
jgi:tetratricopeptide (TPR) repeat protein